MSMHSEQRLLDRRMCYRNSCFCEFTYLIFKNFSIEGNMLAGSRISG